MATPKACREEIHQIMVANLPGSGLIEADDIYKFRTARFRDDFPVHAWVGTHRINAEPLNQGDQLPYYQYRILLAARYTDKASEQAAEEALDVLELLTIETFAPADVSSVWESLDFLPGPERISMEIFGKFYRVAQQIIKVEIN